MNKQLFDLTFRQFKQLISSQQIELDEDQLLIIYQLIQNNRYALIDSHYHRVIYNYISEKINIPASQKFKQLILNGK